MKCYRSLAIKQRPYFPYWLAGPAVVYAVDKMISLSRRRIFLPVIGAELLPSGTAFYLSIRLLLLLVHLF